MNWFRNIWRPKQSTPDPDRPQKTRVQPKDESSTADLQAAGGAARDPSAREEKPKAAIETREPLHLELYRAGAISEAKQVLERLFADDTTRDDLWDFWQRIQRTSLAKQGETMVETPVEWNLPFRAISRLGSGGAADVYAAQCERTKREVAVKVHRKIDARFFSELRNVGRIQAPHILPVLDIYPQQGALVFPKAEETLRSHSLRISSWDALHEQVRRLFEAVHELHQAGFVHRDLKPSNVLLWKNSLFLHDLGSACLIGEDPKTSGVQLGTRAFLAPEGGNVKAETSEDIYSLGMWLRGLSEEGIRLPSEIARLADQCMQSSPLARPTLATLMDAL